MLIHRDSKILRLRNLITDCFVSGFATLRSNVTDLRAVVFGLKTALAAGDDVVTYTTGRAGTCEDTKNIAGTGVGQGLSRSFRCRRSGGNRLNSDLLDTVAVSVATVIS